VLGLAFGIPAICVDIHVHRISNRLGLIRSRNPDESEKALEQILPARFWIGINTLLVAFGQQVCTPVSPWCSGRSREIPLIRSLSAGKPPGSGRQTPPPSPRRLRLSAD
jgi:endonuclease III